jgi:CBS domain containing-hemolysin-like protein
VKNALRLNDVTVRELITPRDAVYCLPAELPLKLVKLQAEH